MRWASVAFAFLVEITMPSATTVLQAICSFGIFSTSIMQVRQLPSTGRSGCQQKCWMWMPLSSAACSTVVPGATSISLPSMVHLGIGPYLSSSPATTFSPPMMATASAIRPPLIMCGYAW